MNMRQSLRAEATPLPGGYASGSIRNEADEKFFLVLFLLKYSKSPARKQRRYREAMLRARSETKRMKSFFGSFSFEILQIFRAEATSLPGGYASGSISAEADEKFFLVPFSYKKKEQWRVYGKLFGNL